MALPFRARDMQLPSVRRAQMQQEMLFQAERNRIARARLARGGDSRGSFNDDGGDGSLLDDEQQSRYNIDPDVLPSSSSSGSGIPRSHADRQQMHVAAFLDDYISEHSGHRPNHHRLSSAREARQRMQERARADHDENGTMLQCLSSALLFVRKHLKLWVSVGVTVYASSLLNAQTESKGWLPTRRVGYKEVGQCMQPNSHYGVSETGGTPNIATIFVSYMDAAKGDDPCFAGSNLNTLRSALNGDSPDDDNNFAAFLTEEQLDFAVANSGVAHSYFPSLRTIMVLAVCTALSSLALDSSDLDRNPREAAFRLAGGRDLTFLQRFNHVTSLFLFLLMSLSAQYVNWLKSEICLASLGVQSRADVNQKKIDLCAMLSQNFAEIASVVDPPEPWVLAYKGIITSMAFLLLVGIVVKPPPGAAQPNVAGVMPGGFFALVQRLHGQGDDVDNAELALRSRSQRRQERDRIARNDLSRRQGASVANTANADAEAFAERYQLVAKRKRMTESWMLLQHLPAGSSDEDRNRCCTVCLEPLFPNAADGDGDGGGVCGYSLVDPLDLEANLPAKTKAGAEAGAETGAATGAPEASNGEGADSGDLCFELPCRHRYHRSCILEWALHHSTCPECRSNLDGSADGSGGPTAAREDEEETEN